MRPVVFAAAAALAVVITAAAGAQLRPQEAAGTIRARQANYKQMAAAVKGIRDQLGSERPSVPAIRRGSRTIAGYAVQVLRWFPRGSGPEAGIPTRARPEIWSDHRGFTRAGAALLVAARGLDRAARSGDLGAIRTALPAVTRACSGCHDDFRAPEL